MISLCFPYLAIVFLMGEKLVCIVKNIAIQVLLMLRRAWVCTIQNMSAMVMGKATLRSLETALDASSASG